MADLFDNPLGLDGFEFVEFCAPAKGTLEPVFERLGFALVARHRSKDVQLWRQGAINLVANYEPRSPAAYFAAEHGASACGMAFRVRDAQRAYALALERGAEPVEVRTGPMELRLPAIRGIGGSIIYLIDRYDAGAGELSVYDIDFVHPAGVDRHPPGAGLRVIDHLTHNVYGGRMAHWAAFYERVFAFREIRRFAIEGEHTGLASKAMAAPDGKIRIPLNEEGDKGGGQIEEYLRVYNGEGIQHIAFASDDLYAACDALATRGAPFAPPPLATYYEMLDERLPGHGEPVAELAKRGILLDGSTDGGDPRLLLQIFSQPMIGPVFFEFIQRKKDDGFGEGNFTALFKSMEADQLRRGALRIRSRGVNKFTPLANYVRTQRLRTFDLTFRRIEEIIGGKLPDSAKRPQYWANTSAGTGPVRSAMKDTPYDTFLVIGSNRVEFRLRA